MIGLLFVIKALYLESENSNRFYFLAALEAYKIKGSHGYCISDCSKFNSCL